MISWHHSRLKAHFYRWNLPKKTLHTSTEYVYPPFCLVLRDGATSFVIGQKRKPISCEEKIKECEELVTSKWPITNWNKKATIFKLDLPRLRNVWWVVRSSRISCFLSTSIRRLFLIYLWRLSGNLSLLSFLPVQKTNEIIPVSGGKFALVAGTVTLPFDSVRSNCLRYIGFISAVFPASLVLGNGIPNHWQYKSRDQSSSVD